MVVSLIIYTIKKLVGGEKRMRLRTIKKALAWCLCLGLLFQAGSTTSIFALENVDGTIPDPTCENHKTHDAACGYAAGSIVTVEKPGTECTHEHTQDCYIIEENCVKSADRLESGMRLATPGQPDKPEHSCSEVSGCITKSLNCSHQESGHDNTCGYTPPTEEVDSKSPCTHSCDQCVPADVPALTKPIPIPLESSEDVTDILTNKNFVVMQGGQKIQEGGRLNPTEPIGIAVSFDVPDDTIDEGDTAGFLLSAGLKIGTAINGPLYFSGEKVGDIQFDLDSTTDITTATVTFSELVDNIGITDIKVDFAADMQYNGSGEAGDAGDHVIQILEKDFIVAIPEKTTTIITTKTGTANVADKTIRWEAVVDAVIEGTSPGSLESCTFIDNLTDVGEYVPDSFRIGIAADAMNTPDPQAVYDPSTKVLTYDFSSADAGKKYISFQTAIPQKLLDANGKQTVTNTAGVETQRPNVVTKDGTGKAEFTMMWIEKNGTAMVGTNPDGTYDPENQKIQWSITANHNGVSLKEAVITDEFQAGLTFESATLQKGLPNGDWGTAATITPTDHEYRLGDIDTKILLTITTKVDDTNPPSGITNYNNKATIRWEGLDKGIGASSKPVGIGFAPIKKVAKDYDASKHEISWSVSIDAQSQNYGTGLHVLDLVVYGESGFEKNAAYTISDNSRGNLFDVTADEIKHLTPRYHQKYAGSFTADSNLGIVVHTLTDDDGKAVADLLVVTSADGTAGIDNKTLNSFSYKSVVTNPALYASNKTNIKIENTAALFNVNALVSQASASRTFKSEMLFKNMLAWDHGAALEADPTDITKLNANAAKDKAFNYLNKSVYFKIHVNANGLTDAANDITTVDGERLGDFLVTDTLPPGWGFEKIGGKDFLLYKGSKSTTPGVIHATGPVDEGDYDSIFSGGIPVSPTDTAGGKIEFNFTSLTQPYVILVKVAPTIDTAEDYFNKNGTYTIRNDAMLSAGGTELAGDWEEASIKSQLITKKLDQLNANTEGYLQWRVEYNPYGFEHKDAYLEDTLPLGLDLRTNSRGELILKDHITVTELVLNADGTCSDTGSDVEIQDKITYNPQTRVLHFQIPDSQKAYRLSYLTDITGTTGTAENKVSMFGGIIPPNGAVDHKSYTITSASSGASFKRSGWLLVTKQDGEGNPLPGAEFTLFAEDGTTIIRQGITANDGKIYLKVIPEGDYILKETIAPAGYVPDIQPHIVTVSKDEAGKIFTTVVDGQTGINSHEITIKNYKTGTVGGLKIEKRVSGNDGDSEQLFDFTLTLSNKTTSYKYIGDGVQDKTIQSGDIISLAHNQSITVVGLPQGTTYSVTEKDYTADGYTVTKSGDSGKIIADEIHNALFINTKNRSDTDMETGSLRIAKMVSGDAGEMTRTFDFTLRLSDTAGSYEYIGVGLQGGMVKNGDTIQLGHNQSITVVGLPKDTTYTVTETDYTPDGYTTVQTGDSGKIIANSTQTAVFTNTRNSSGDSGGGDSGGGDSGGGDTGGGDTGGSSSNIPQDNLEIPENPIHPAEYPFYTIDMVPDPNLPDSPDKITIVNENNDVIGVYTKTALPDGTYIYISDEGVPLGSIELVRISEDLPYVQKPKSLQHPQTGNGVPVELFLIIFVSSLFGVGVLALYKKKCNTK